MSECFMADVKHGLALFPGTEEEVVQAIERIGKACNGKTDGLLVAMVGRDVNDTEAEYMRTTCMLPRRVKIRLSK